MKFTINNNLRLLTCPLLLAGAVCCSSGNDGDTPAPGPGPDPSPVTGDVLAYVTSADGNRLFTEEGLDYSKVSMSPYRVTIDPSTTYQTVDGFGPAITGATCYNLLQMSQADRTAILRKCFDPETGAGFSFIRVHIGGSDFSMDEYTCCDREGIEFFAIPAVEKDGIFPVLKEILEINPEIKIMGSPWSCPKWMKGTVADPSKPYDSWTGGRLNPAYYDDYAEYFVQWVTEMEENGFPIYAITMQNEPLNKGNSMSLYMPWEDQLAFVKKLGPAFRKAGIDTKILCYDHNYNYDNVAGQQNYPLNIYADADAAQWVDGSAWHNYGGSVSELDNTVPVLKVKLNGAPAERLDLTPYLGENSVWVTVPLDASKLRSGTNRITLDSNVDNSANFADTSLDIYFTASRTAEDTELSTDGRLSWMKIEDHRYANIYLELHDAATDTWGRFPEAEVYRDTNEHTVIGRFSANEWLEQYNFRRAFVLEDASQYDGVRACIQLHVGSDLTIAE